MSNLTSLLIILTLLSSCSTDNSRNQSTSISIKKNFLEVGVDNKTSNFSRGLQAYSNQEDEFLFNINWNQNSLQIYDLKTGNFKNEVFFQTEGNDAVGRIFGYYVHNMDSIFLFTQQTSEIILIDSASTIKSRIDYEVPGIFSNAFVHNAYFISTPILKNNELLVKTHLQGNYRSMTDEELEKKSITYSVNIESGKVELLDQKYPEDYLNEGLKFFEYSMAGNTEKVVFSFFGDHRLFYTSAANENELKSKEVKSTYLKDKLPLFPVNGAREATYEYLFASDHYESLLYDKYRNIYYRFAFPAQEFENMKELGRFRDAPNSFSIMILDQNLDVIEELLFDESRLVPNNVFIGTEGLYISTSHPENPEVKEDKMVFDLLKVEI